MEFRGLLLGEWAAKDTSLRIIFENMKALDIYTVRRPYGRIVEF